MVVGWEEKSTKNLAKRLALSLDKFYADVEDLMEYYLTDSQENIQKLCGVEYLEKLKLGVIKDVSNYENAIIYVPLYIFVYQDNCNLLSKNAHIIFVDIKDRELKKVFSDKEKYPALKTLTLKNRIDFCRLKCDKKIVSNCTHQDKLFKSANRIVKKIFRWNKRE